MLKIRGISNAEHLHVGVNRLGRCRTSHRRMALDGCDGRVELAQPWDCARRDASSRGRQHRLYLIPLPHGHGSLRPGRCAMAQGYYGREQARAPLRQLSSTLSPFDRTAARLGALDAARGVGLNTTESRRFLVHGAWFLVRSACVVLGSCVRPPAHTVALPPGRLRHRRTVVQRRSAQCVRST